MSDARLDAAPLKDAHRLSFNQATAERASLKEVVESCAKHCVPSVAVWRHKLHETGVDVAVRVRPVGCVYAR